MQRLQDHITSLRHIFTFQSAKFPPLQQYRVNLLTVIVTSNLITAISLLLYIFFAGSTRTVAITMGCIVAILLDIWLLQRIQRGQTEVASRLVIGGGWVVMTFIIYGSNGLYSSGIMVLMSMLILGTLILKTHAKYVLFIATITFFVALLFIELSGNLPPSPFKDLPFRIFILSTTATSLFLIINYHLFASKASEKRLVILEVDNERYKVQRQLTQDLAHDLRTPIATLKTSAYLIRKKQARNLPLDDTLDKLELQADRLNNMIEDLFKLTLLETDTTRPLDVIDLTALVRSCIVVAQPYADTQNIKLLDTLQEQTYHVLGHEKQLQQVFNNLIENAIHYNNSGGYVETTIQVTNNLVVVSIADNGIGIATEDQARIFERFYMVDEARTATQKSGNGIGLNLVKRIIQLHQGEVSVESELGVGSTFTIRLPAHQPAD